MYTCSGKPRAEIGGAGCENHVEKQWKSMCNTHLHRMITIVLIGQANACYKPHMSWHIRFLTDRVQTDDNIAMITQHVFDDQIVVCLFYLHPI